MSTRLKLDANKTNLVRRYLMWCYKTTKEDLDRTDRYFTQWDVDQFFLDHLCKTEKVSREAQGLINNFEEYMHKKKDNAHAKKFKEDSQKELNPEYEYLHYRFDAIEQAIVHFLGKDELKKITELYEQEMTQRILTAREHA